MRDAVGLHGYADSFHGRLAGLRPRIAAFS
jgi:hypothetical protein